MAFGLGYLRTQLEELGYLFDANGNTVPAEKIVYLTAKATGGTYTNSVTIPAGFAVGFSVNPAVAFDNATSALMTITNQSGVNLFGTGVTINLKTLNTGFIPGGLINGVTTVHVTLVVVGSGTVGQCRVGVKLVPMASIAFV